MINRYYKPQYSTDKRGNFNQDTLLMVYMIIATKIAEENPEYISEMEREELSITNQGAVLNAVNKKDSNRREIGNDYFAKNLPRKTFTEIRDLFDNEKLLLRTVANYESVYEIQKVYGVTNIQDRSVAYDKNKGILLKFGLSDYNSRKMVYVTFANLGLVLDQGAMPKLKMGKDDYIYLQKALSSYRNFEEIYPEIGLSDGALVEFSQNKFKDKQVIETSVSKLSKITGQVTGSDTFDFEVVNLNTEILFSGKAVDLSDMYAQVSNKNGFNEPGEYLYTVYYANGINDTWTSTIAEEKPNIMMIISSLWNNIFSDEEPEMKYKVEIVQVDESVTLVTVRDTGEAWDVILNTPGVTKATITHIKTGRVVNDPYPSVKGLGSISGNVVAEETGDQTEVSSDFCESQGFIIKDPDTSAKHLYKCTSKTEAQACSNELKKVGEVETIPNFRPKLLEKCGQLFADNSDNKVCQEHNADWSCQCSMEQCDANSEECQTGLCQNPAVLSMYCCSDAAAGNEKGGFLKNIGKKMGVLFNGRKIESSNPIVIPRKTLKESTYGFTAEQMKLFDALAEAQKNADYDLRDKIVNILKDDHKIDARDLTKYPKATPETTWSDHWASLGSKVNVEKEVNRLKENIGDKNAVYVLRDTTGAFHLVEDVDGNQIDISTDKNNYLIVDASKVKEKTTIKFSSQRKILNKKGQTNALGSFSIDEDGGLISGGNLFGKRMADNPELNFATNAPNMKVLTKSSVFYIDDGDINIFLSVTAADEFEKITELQKLLNDNKCTGWWKGEAPMSGVTKEGRQCNEWAAQRDALYLDIAKILSKTLYSNNVIDKDEFNALENTYKELKAATGKSMSLYDMRVALIRKAMIVLNPENKALRLNNMKIELSQEQIDNYIKLSGYQKIVNELYSKKSLSDKERKDVLDATDKRTKLKNAMWEACYPYLDMKPADKTWYEWWAYLAGLTSSEGESAGGADGNDGATIETEEGTTITTIPLCGATIDDSNYDTYVDENGVFKYSKVDCEPYNTGLTINIGNDKEITFKNVKIHAKEFGLNIISGSVYIYESNIKSEDVGILFKDGTLEVYSSTVLSEVGIKSEKNTLKIEGSTIFGRTCDIIDETFNLKLDGFVIQDKGINFNYCLEQVKEGYDDSKYDCRVTINKDNYDELVTNKVLTGLPSIMGCKRAGATLDTGSGPTLTIDLPADKEIYLNNMDITGDTALKILNGIVYIKGGSFVGENKNMIGDTPLGPGISVQGGEVKMTGVKMGGNVGLLVGTQNMGETNIKVELDNCEAKGHDGITIYSGRIHITDGVIMGTGKANALSAGVSNANYKNDGKVGTGFGITIYEKGSLQLINKPFVSGTKRDIIDCTKKFYRMGYELVDEGVNNYCNYLNREPDNIFEKGYSNFWENWNGEEETTPTEPSTAPSDDGFTITSLCPEGWTVPDVTTKATVVEDNGHAACRAKHPDPAWSCQCAMSEWTAAKCDNSADCERKLCSDESVITMYCCSTSAAKDKPTVEANPQKTTYSKNSELKKKATSRTPTVRVNTGNPGNVGSASFGSS
ncbi:MAG: hypothetical protein KKF89_06000 [Nanoarchaeota archaeon]|nr:hypothetical protein [Nanoarchaeota archaeon]